MQRRQSGFKKFPRRTKWVEPDYREVEGNDLSLQVLSDESKRKNYDTYGMGSDPFSSGPDAYQGEETRTNSSRASQGGFRGYEYYQSQVDPEELFRKIFGDAFSRAGFGNHDWMNEPDENVFGREGITQVNRSFVPPSIDLLLESS